MIPRVYRIVLIVSTFESVISIKRECVTKYLLIVAVSLKYNRAALSTHTARKKRSCGRSLTFLISLIVCNRLSVQRTSVSRGGKKISTTCSVPTVNYHVFHGITSRVSSQRALSSVRGNERSTRCFRFNGPRMAENRFCFTPVREQLPSIQKHRDTFLPSRDTCDL